MSDFGPGSEPRRVSGAMNDGMGICKDDCKPLIPIDNSDSPAFRSCAPDTGVTNTLRDVTSP